MSTLTQKIKESTKEYFEPVVDLYWAIWRFFMYSYWSTPTKICRSLKWQYQRLTRGWSDRDAWSIDSYISSWMPDALRHLKKHKLGTPAMIYETDMNPAQADDKWDAILDKMIEGFESAQRLAADDFEDEIGEYPLKPPITLNTEEKRQLRQEYMAKYRAAWDRHDAIRIEGMNLFVRYFHCLWD